MVILMGGMTTLVTSRIGVHVNIHDLMLNHIEYVSHHAHLEARRCSNMRLWWPWAQNLNHGGLATGCVLTWTSPTWTQLHIHLGTSKNATWRPSAYFCQISLRIPSGLNGWYFQVQDGYFVTLVATTNSLRIPYGFPTYLRPFECSWPNPYGSGRGVQLTVHIYIYIYIYQSEDFIHFQD